MTIYELQQQYRSVFEMIEEMEGDITGQEEAIEALFTEIKEQGSQKLESCGHIINSLNLQANGLKEDEKRLKAKRERYEKTAEKIKERCKSYLETIDVKKIQAGHFVFSIVNNPPSIVFEDDNPDLFPHEAILTVKSVSKTVMKDWFKNNSTNEYIKDGKSLAYIVQKTRLDIK